jgi:hypothetical protein
MRRLPFFSQYRQGLDSIELPEHATVTVEVVVRGLPAVVQTEAGNAMSTIDPIPVPLEALVELLAEHVDKPRRRTREKAVA